MFLLWPSILRLARRYMANKAEDFLRNATGMPPRPGSQRAKREAAQDRSSDDSRRRGYSYRYGRDRRATRHTGPIIPKEYAEDVEFVETKSFPQTTIDETSDSGTRQWNESQVSDAEWVEIKDPVRKK